MTDAARRCPGRPRDPQLDDGILAAAIAVAAERGLDALTMEGVARRAGVAKATVYRRFPSKVDLIVATCHALAPPLPAAPDEGNVRDDLVTLMESVAAAITAPANGRLMPSLIAASADNPEVREALGRFSAGRRSLMRSVLRRAARRGELRDGVDVDLLGDQLVGTVLYRYLVAGRPVGSAVLRRLVDQALSGARTFRAPDDGVPTRPWGS